MKHVSFIGIAGLLVVAACAPLTTYYKPGVSVDTLNRQTTTCQVKALRDVPASTQIRQLPPEYVPARHHCTAPGNCAITRHAYVIPGDVVTYDPNDGLRKRVEGQCMADRGFAPVSIPPCPDGVARATPARATKVLPPLNPQSCVIRNSNGSFQIVTRG